MELFTLQEAAAELRMCVSTLRRHVAAGNIGYLVMGHGRARQHIRFRRDDLEFFLAQQQRRRERPEPRPPEWVPSRNDRSVEANVQRCLASMWRRRHK